MNSYNRGFSGANTSELKEIDMAKYEELLANPTGLENYVAGNSVFVAAENKINAGAAAIPTVNPVRVKSGIKGAYDANQPGYTPLAGTPTPASAQAQIKTEETPKKTMLPAGSGTSVKPEGFNSYLGGYVENFFASGLEDVRDLGFSALSGSSFKPVPWNPGSYEPAMTTYSAEGFTPAAESYNANAAAYNAQLLKEQNAITDSLLPEASNLASGYSSDYENNPLTAAGNNVFNDNEFLNPTNIKGAKK